MSGQIETRGAKIDFDQGRVTAEFTTSQVDAIRELRQSDVPPELWPPIIRATRKKQKQAWWLHILSRLALGARS